MKPVVKPKLFRAEATEARIVAAATELFVQRGYRGTTMSDVAQQAGASDRTVYVRFATKADSSTAPSASPSSVTLSPSGSPAGTGPSLR